MVFKLCVLTSGILGNNFKKCNLKLWNLLQQKFPIATHNRLQQWEGNHLDNMPVLQEKHFNRCHYDLRCKQVNLSLT